MAFAAGSDIHNRLDFEGEVIMAWEGLGGTLNPGETHFWTYSWGAYHNWDLASARPLSPASVLRVSGHGSRLDRSTSYLYFVNVTNEGPFVIEYHLTGPS